MELFRKAGYNVYVSSRGYRPACDDDDLELFLIRAQEIGRYVNDGFIDCGITGRDWIYENRADVEVLTDLQYSKATSKPTRWVLVVPENSPITCAEDLQGKRIATEGVGITERWLQEKGIEAHVEFSWGATEVKVPELVDAIVDITETGSSIKANKLRIVDTLMTSYPQFIANRETMQDEWKKQKLERLVMMLKGALEARRKVGLKMNLPAASLNGLVEALPSLRRPTISHLAEEGWLAVETVIDESVVRDIIPQLKALGAEGIIEYHSKTTNEPQSWDRSKNAVKQKSTSISAASACVRTVTRSVCVTSPKVCALRCSNWQSVRFPENSGVLLITEGRRFLCI